MKIVYIDMDGVLADLSTGLQNTYGFKNENNHKFLPVYVEDEGFVKNPVLDGAHSLVSHLLFQAEEGLCNLAILTSVGNYTSLNSKVVDQKKRWLEKNFPALYMIPFCCTTSGDQKSLFAHANSVLIDDHPSNIAKFNVAGGYGILYNSENYKNAISSIESHLLYTSIPDGVY